MNKQFEYKKGIAIRINNPEGHNKHTPKANLKPKKEEVEITKEMVQEAYRNKLRAKNDYLSKSQTYTFLNVKFMGYDKIDEEFTCQKSESVKSK